MRLVGLLLLAALSCLAPDATSQPSVRTLRAELEAMEARTHTDPAAVLAELEQALPTFEQADRETRLWYLLRRAQAHLALFMYDEFQEDISQAQADLIVGAPSELALWIQSYAGIIEIHRGEINRGVEILAGVAERALAKNASRVYVFAVQELAYTRGMLERYTQSLDDLQKAYAMAATVQQLDLIAMVNDAYGAVYAYLGDYPRSISYYEKSLADFEYLGYKNNIASVVLGLASTNRYAENWDAAERYYNRYLDVTSYALGDQHLFNGHYGLAMTIADRGDCERAVPQIRLALSYGGPIDYNAELYKILAICQIEQGELEAGATSLENAREILTSIKELEGTSWVLDLTFIESRLELARRNTAKAYALLDEYHEASTRQLTNASSDRMNMIRADLESNRQELEIALLEQQAEVYRLQLQSYISENKFQRSLILTTVAVTLLVIVGLLFQWRSTRRIRELSHRDGLSGLYNRNFTFNYLEQVIPRINVDSGGLSTILLDVDNFKSINDRFGHPTGDEVIRKIAAIGEVSLRSRDIMGRIGGEEFLCVLPRATAEQSMQVAERLLQAISEETFRSGDGQEFSVSISIGVADYDHTVKNADDLYNRADQALYRAKTAGKGCIATFQTMAPLATAAIS